MAPDRLWAPWRIGFILAPKAGGCFLCDHPAESDDAAHLILERRTTGYVVLNRFPYNNGHLLVAPYRHVADLAGLTADELRELFELTRDWVEVLRRALNPHGFNIGMNLGEVAGAGVPGHVHMHVVPRWSGDVNFLSAIADTRLINQSLEECYRLLAQTRRRPAGSGGGEP
ncbi:MAG TPA: HIT domain-containing protein [Candidatus Nitrosotenuis sp.]|jgi:ATP adenylyltransferase|nr:HIT domain-containing protein [Candidatus Nitrosotenuis sp.]